LCCLLYFIYLFFHNLISFILNLSEFWYSLRCFCILFKTFFKALHKFLFERPL
jgi:hypothetical protein